MQTTLTLTVNGSPVTAAVDPRMTLLRFLREHLSLSGTKNGCAKGHCGACTVIVDGKAKRACIVLMGKLDGAVVETIEGLAASGTLHPIQQSFLDEGAVQCGFCTPGMIMSTKTLLDRTADPSDAEIREALRHNLCRCTGYGAIVRAIRRAAVLLRDPAGASTAAVREAEVAAFRPDAAVGVSHTKKDGRAKVTGAPVFADDLPAENALHGVMLFSSHAHARIRSIDLSAAAASPGVVRILTGKDVPGRNAFGLFVPQQPVIAVDEVRYLGEVVAVVLAEERRQAEIARDLIRVEYEPLPALLSAAENFAPGAAKVHPELPDNVVHHVAVRKGDSEAAFERADVVVEGEYETQAVEHAYLEPESCLALRDPEGGITCRTGSQGSHAYRGMIAASLALPEDKVRVIMTAVGGGFGGKEEPTVQIQACLGAMLTGRPVKMVLSREDSIRTSTKRHPMRIRMKHGAMSDGRIVAMSSHVVADAGAYISQTKPVIFRSAVTATGPYVVENVTADSWGIYTHNNPNGAFRGFGSTQVSFAAEIQMDRLARELGMDPAELRRRNGFAPGTVTSTGQVLKDGIGYLGTLEASREALDRMRHGYADLRLPEGVRLGFGIASAYKNVGIGTGLSDHAGASVGITAEGRLLVKTGAADLGQGSDTLAAQIAAEALGVPYSLVDVISCDTAICPDGGMTTASRQTFVTGNAVRKAADELRGMLDGISSPELRTREDLLEARRRAEACGLRPEIDTVYTPPGTGKHTPGADHAPGQPLSDFDIHYAYCFASAVIALTVDTATGVVTPLRLVLAQDVGRAINPQSVVGQIEGAAAMGIGYALSEDFRQDERDILTPDLRKIGVPFIGSLPEIEAIIVEEPQPEGPYGAKGMGEVGLNPVAPAVSNAIFDAVGVRLTRLPMTRDRVLAALAPNGARP